MIHLGKIRADIDRARVGRQRGRAIGQLGVEVGYELVLSAGAAEMVTRTSKGLLVGRLQGIHGHAADRILYFSISFFHIPKPKVWCHSS